MKFVTLKVNTSRTVDFLRQFVPPIMWKAAYRAAVVKDIPANYAYDPHYSPWLEPAFKARVRQVQGNTGIKPPCLYTLVYQVRQCFDLPGDVVECGVWRGGSARLLRDEIIAAGVAKQLHLFDSFEGMARVDSGQDRHDVGDFDDTSLEHVQEFVTGNRSGDEAEIAVFHKGWIPETFSGTDLRICFAHIDLDLYQSIIDTLNYVYPRLASRGVIVFDDYGFASCPGARRAVDEFFADKPEKPYSLSSGQAFLVKH